MLHWRSPPLAVEGEILRAHPDRGYRAAGMAGTIGWREFAEDEWHPSNADDAHLLLKGIGDALAASQQDRDFVYFHYVATIRVEEEDDDLFLTSLGGFLDGVPKVKSRWRDGTLIGPGDVKTSRVPSAWM